jgi:hypothetical protein
MAKRMKINPDDLEFVSVIQDVVPGGTQGLGSGI